METEKKKTEKQESAKQKSCFIITPIGDENSEIRRKADGLIEAIVKPVLENLGYVPIIPHTMTKPGSITTQVVEHILSSDMVIANLTGLNPNVMYELAVRHAVRKPIVCVVENGTKLPFDIAQDRVILYSDEFFRVETLKKDLKQMIESASKMGKGEIDNPIYRAQSNTMVQRQLEKSPNTTDADVLKLILERLTKLEDSANYNSNRRLPSVQNHYSFRIEYENPFNRDTSNIDDSVRTYLRNMGVRASVALENDRLIRVMIIRSPLQFDEIMDKLSLMLNLDYNLKDINFRF